MIYLICETDITYGLTPICYYDNKQDAQTALHYIEAISHDLNKMQEQLNAERRPISSVWDTWSESKKTEWHNRWGANNMWAENAIRTIHHDLREYHDYMIIEIEPGKIVPKIQ
jgi:hypothetical protein